MDYRYVKQQLLPDSSIYNPPLLYLFLLQQKDIIWTQKGHDGWKFDFSLRKNQR
jgi:hypothetical protein